MAKIQQTKKGNNKQPKGTMPADMLARYKLTGNISEPYTSKAFRNDKTVRKFSRMVSNYRTFVHGCTEGKLPSSLRQTVQYFCVPMTRSDSDNPKDKRNNVEVVEGSEANNVSTT